MNGFTSERRADRMSIHDDTATLAGDGTGSTRALALCARSAEARRQALTT
jgi:hypothetical protein